MDFLAYAMGGLGKGEGGEGGGFGAFLPLLLVFVVAYIVIRIIRKYAKKGLRESICDDCLIVYTKGEKFCKKCGSSLTEK